MPTFDEMRWEAQLRCADSSGKVMGRKFYEYFGCFAEEVKRNAMVYREANIVSNVWTDFRLT